jgi:hypothetical protein
MGASAWDSPAGGGRRCSSRQGGRCHQVCVVVQSGAACHHSAHITRLLPRLPGVAGTTVSRHATCTVVAMTVAVSQSAEGGTREGRPSEAGEWIALAERLWAT